jgi:hypothetical protein
MKPGNCCCAAAFSLSLLSSRNDDGNPDCVAVPCLVCRAVARVSELEAELAVVSEVLRLPGIKSFVMRRFHPDKPDITDAERQWLTGAMQKVNAAYEALAKEAGQ